MKEDYPTNRQTGKPDDGSVESGCRLAGLSAIPKQPPDPIPARMLNEFVYCPRLFYYEHIEGIFCHNADTLEGKYQHARVDSKKAGKLPPDKKGTDSADSDESSAELPAQPETIHARSVELASDALGVNAKLDLVEGEVRPDGSIAVQPVEYKHGAPRQDEAGENTIWDADKMQLGLQILLLRDNGYPCDSGVVFYRETRQRVTFAPTDADIGWIKENIASARAAATRPIPSPLENSSKCPRCSLCPVCLPDETRMLAGDGERSGGVRPVQPDFDFGDFADVVVPPGGDWSLVPDAALPAVKPADKIRRLIAPNDVTRPLYLNTPGAYVRLRGETLIAEKEGEKIGEYRLLDIHHLALMGPVQISTQVVQTCCERGIPIAYFSMGGFFYGIAHGHALVNVTTRIAQFAQAADPAAALRHARLFLHGKIRNQRTLMMRNHVEMPDALSRSLKWLASSALVQSGIPSLLGVEGTAARFYFADFGAMLRSERGESAGDGRFAFDFKERNRRPPRDPVNAVLSLLYSLLVKDCVVACFACGLDPYVGFLHQPRHGKPALALDLMEEFRPLVADSAALTLFNNRMLARNDFISAGRAVALAPAARKTVFLAYEKRLADVVTHPVFDYKVSYRRAIELQARLLAKTLTGEIADYIPFMTR